MKTKPLLTIFYQFDPWSSSIGGIQTFICSFLKYAPPEFDIKFVGTASEDADIGRWQSREFAGRKIDFMPLIKVENDDVRPLIPTTLKYTLALLRHDFSSDFMHFHRVEAALATSKWQGEKSFFIHNDIEKQMSSQDGNNAILWQKFPAAYFALEKYLIRQFDRIFSCHTATAQLYQEKYPALASRIDYLRNTVDEEIFYPLYERKQAQKQSLAGEMGLEKNTKFVLFAGRLHPQKDPLLLIEAFAALNEPQTHLLVAGAGELETKIHEAIAKQNLVGKVTLLGAVPQARLAELHRISSVFVLSSVYEGLPMTVLEALSSGTPVVTTNAGETPNFLQENSGVVCQQRTPEAIATALKQVLHNPEQYPASACVETAKPYSAKAVVGEVYQNMYRRWQASNGSAQKLVSI